MRKTIIALALAALASGASLANDSVAEMAVGGLVLKQTDDIDIVSEHLYVSEERIRVRYVFRNRRPTDVSVTVAFPMPDRDLAEPAEGDTSWPSDFATRVNDASVAMQVERRAVHGGADHSATLAELGIPIAGDNIAVAAEEAIDRLPRAQQDWLVAMGLVQVHEYETGEGVRRAFSPRWRVKETWFWEQVFPAGRDLVVEHEYTPAVGGSIDSLLALRDLRELPENRGYFDDFCVEPSFVAAVDRLLDRARTDRPIMLSERRVRYVLTTGANWASPIGEFRLVVDKGSPDNLVSFCGSGLRRISPTQFEMRRSHWRPDRDLAVLIVVPYRPE